MGAPVRFTAEERAAITQAAYAAGDLRPAMTRTQRIAWKKLSAKRHPVFFLDCSRRWGKTRFLVLVCVMTALRTKNAIIRYCAPTKSHGRTFVTPAMQWACEMLPDSKRPRFVTQDNTWVFPSTGARIVLGSAETIPDCDSQVGTECHLAIFDESAKVRSDVLKYLHQTVILPQFLTVNGTLIVGSTPAITPAHYLNKNLRGRAMMRDAYVKFTIDDCDHLTEDAKREVIEEIGGLDTPAARRELYCEHVPDRDWLIVPEFLDAKPRIVVERQRPAYCDWYVVGDLGFEDLSVVLFAYYDFERAKIVVEDEVAEHRVSGLVIGHAVKAKEVELGILKPQRYADAPVQLLADLSDEKYGPGINFGLPLKDDADAALNALRMRMAREQIEIHPRCKTLLAHLECGVWNTARSSFDRMEGFGHWDAIDALKYLSRMVDTKRNPFPILAPGMSIQTHHIPQAIHDQMAHARQTFRALR